jgi:uncharacterized secreted protein with C-terminal beta-propeller domain
MQKEIKKRAWLYGAAAILLALILSSTVYNMGYVPHIQIPQQSVFKAFASTEEIKDYLTTNARTYDPLLLVGPADRNVGPLPTLMNSQEYKTPSGLSQAPEYSTTNIQVSGVDEIDIVKTDGEYLYVISGTNVFILKGYPSEEAKILSKIALNDTNLVGIFVSEKGNRLGVLGCKYRFPEFYPGRSYGSVIYDVKTFLNVYDTSNKSAPSFLTNFTMTGSYFNSRMIGDYVYFVVSQQAYIILETVILPKVITSNGIKEIAPSDILYSETSDEYFMYTTIVAMNIQDTTEEPTYKTVMLGGTSGMYVSLSNIYITFQESDRKTMIHRIHIENSTITPEATGTVPGYELSQFAMDEYNNHFRIATTTTTWINWTTITQNNLYILDMNLSIVGSLENFAPPSEIMDSARFMGDRCYLSTSVRQMDPFFVIDVSNASKPEILGDLDIPGFTSYLHPYDEDHIIGVGRVGNNVKIRLFDVSNISAPKNMTEFTVDADASWSAVLNDHKAFLFEESKDLLAIPLTIHYWDMYYSYWQGLYVFNVTLNDGIMLRGNVTHQADGTYYEVQRALYIDNVLYTLSYGKVQLNSLEDLAFIKEIQLN